MSDDAHIVRNEPSIFVYQTPVRLGAIKSDASLISPSCSL